MSEFLRIIAALQHQMSATISRSDVLRSLHIMLGTMVFLVLGLSYAGPKIPDWAIEWAFYGLFATMGLELLSFLFCLLVDRDALRSEKYQLSKMAIEARLLGDDTSGMFEVDARPGGARQITNSPRAITASGHALVVDENFSSQPTEDTAITVERKQ